jgi:large-conductance mechanosensitive channel
LRINQSTLFQVFKYALYLFLSMNVYWFFVEEHAANELLYPNGVGIGDIIGAYAATVDTAAWVVLLLMFELETYVLEDRHFTRTVTWSLHTLRAVCYAFIIYAFYGYIGNLLSVTNVSPLADVSNLCSLVADNWSYSHGFEEYTPITAENCGSFSTATSFQQFADARAVVDAAGLSVIIGLAWADVINAGVWLLVVVLLEIDVRLQEHNLFEGVAFKASTVAKFVLYGILFLAAIYWWVYGDFVDFWDAFLWLLAFFFIELNVVEWRQEALEEQAASG